MNHRTLLKKYTRLAGALLYPKENTWLIYFEKQAPFHLPIGSRAMFCFPSTVYFCNKLYTKDSLPPTVWSDIIHELTHRKHDYHNIHFWQEYRENKNKTKELERKFRQELRRIKNE